MYSVLWIEYPYSRKKTEMHYTIHVDYHIYIYIYIYIYFMILHEGKGDRIVRVVDPYSQVYHLTDVCQYTVSSSVNHSRHLRKTGSFSRTIVIIGKDNKPIQLFLNSISTLNISFYSQDLDLSNATCHNANFMCSVV